MQKQQLIILDKIDPNQLPELANFKEKGIALLKGCFFIKIEDNSSYENAKKHRTALKSYRTDVQKSEKAIKDKINSFKNKVQIVSAELIEITQIAENKQQSEIDAWEEKKEQEKREKAIAEQERIDGIKTKISDYVASWKEAFGFMVFGSIKEVSDNFSESNTNFDKTSLQEFDVLFDREVSTLAELLDSKISTLEEQEQIRVDQENLKIQNAIADWFRDWNSKIIFSTTSENCKELFKEFNAELGMNCKQFQKEYAEKRSDLVGLFEARIQMLIDTENAKAEQEKIAEEQRIAQEKLDQEKKEFEEKQAEAKFKERKNILFDEGYWEIFFRAEANENDEIAKSKLVAYSEDDFDKFVDAVKKARTPVEAIEVVGEEEVVELPALEVEPKLEYVDPRNVLPSNTTDKIDEIANHDAFIQEVEFEETWGSIHSLFSDQTQTKKDLSIKDAFEWLEKNYNVPTKKQ